MSTSRVAPPSTLLIALNASMALPAAMKEPYVAAGALNCAFEFTIRLGDGKCWCPSAAEVTFATIQR